MPLLRQLIDGLFQCDSHNNIAFHIRVHTGTGCSKGCLFFKVIERTNAHFDTSNLNTAVKLSRVTLRIYNQFQKFLKTLK